MSLVVCKKFPHTCLVVTSLSFGPISRINQTRRYYLLHMLRHYWRSLGVVSYMLPVRKISWTIDPENLLNLDGAAAT